MAACLLGEATGDESYYTKAAAIMAWEREILFNKETGAVYDHVEKDGVTFNYWASTYNQGTFIGANAMLYLHTGERQYFDDANLAAKYASGMGDGTEGYLNREQDDPDLIGFKSILARWLCYFAVNCNVDDYNDWMYRNAASAWTNRNSDNLMWTQFGKFTDEDLENSTKKLREDKDNEVGTFAGWGSSPAVAWLLDCTGIDAKQEKKQQQTETPGMTAGKIALQKLVKENQAIYEAGQGNCPADVWKEFTDAYEAAANPAGDVTVAQLNAMHAALEEARSGMKNFPGDKIEAESGELAGGASVTDVAACSGGKRIGNVGESAEKTATYVVSAVQSGEHKISVYYCTAQDRDLNIIVNGVSYPVNCKSSGGWNNPGATPAETTILLNKGQNTIVLAGVADAEGKVGAAPNVDWFMFEKIVTEDDAALEEAKENLRGTITQYEGLYQTGQNSYTEESYKEFKNAYDAAVSALSGNESVSAEEMKALQDALTEAESKLEMKKVDGVGTVTIENWIYGEKPKAPVAVSETNGTNHVTYQYKAKGAPDNTYTNDVPTNAGEYTVKAAFAAKDHYNAVVATDDFVIEKKEYTVDAINKSYFDTKNTKDTVDFAAMLPDDCGVIRYGAPDFEAPENGESITLDGDPVVNGDGVLSYAVNSGKAGATGTISVVVTTTNYKDITLEVAISLYACEHSGGAAACEKKAVCTICEEEYGEPGTHVWDAGVITKEPTAAEKGEKTYTCTECGDTKTEELPVKSEQGENAGGENPGGQNPGGQNPGNKNPNGENPNGQNPQGELPEGAESTAEAAEANITSADTDNDDVQGSTFAKLQLKAVGKNKAIKLTWKKVKNADGYIIYGAQCGKSLEKIKTLKGASRRSYTHKKLKKAKYYKYVVVAYKDIDGQRYILASSKSAHAVTTGGKYASPTKVTVKASNITVKKGGKKTIKASYKLPKNKKTKLHIAKFRYESTNPEVATVSKKGVVRGRKKGTAYIYVYTQNGVCKKVKVTVK